VALRGKAEPLALFALTRVQLGASHQKVREGSL
jgi:hypothetical protein